MIRITMSEDEHARLLWLLEELDVDNYASEDGVLSAALDAVRDGEEE